MTSKLDEIRERLRDYDEKMGSVEEEYSYWSTRNAAAFAPDDLRALLAVVDISTAIADVGMFSDTNNDGERYCNSCGGDVEIVRGEWVARHEPDCTVATFLAAVHALTADGSAGAQSAADAEGG